MRYGGVEPASRSAMMVYTEQVGACSCSCRFWWGPRRIGQPATSPSHWPPGTLRDQPTSATSALPAIAKIGS